MARWLLTLLALSAVTVAVVLAIARPGALSRPGTFVQPVAAVADFEPSPTPWAFIDKNINNGDGPCDIRDYQTTETVGSTHRLAVCLGNVPQEVYSFTLGISHDDALDTCTEVECLEGPCLDDNPDANDGEVSEWGGTGLGDGWVCSSMQGDSFASAAGFQLPEPVCNLNDCDPGPGAGEAWISCYASGESTTTLGDQAGETGALAVLTLNVAAAGTDNVEIKYLYVWGDDVPIAQCPTDDLVAFGAALNGDSAFAMDCVGATDTKQSGDGHKRPTRTPTPPPTATPVPPTVPPPPPPPTATPFGGVGPEIVAPATGSGPTDSGTPWAVWLAIAVAGTAAAAGGFYLRFAKGRRHGSG